MRGRIIGAVLAGSSALAACLPVTDARRLDPIVQDLEIAAPRGTVVLEETVDQMLVGDRLMDARQPELALRAYYRAASMQGLTPDILNAIGAANLKLGRIGQAERQFRQALRLDPVHVPALNNLGVALMEQGAFGEARRQFEAAFAHDSGQSDAIRENLRRAIARMENVIYSEENNQKSTNLIRRSEGVYTLLGEP